MKNTEKLTIVTVTYNCAEELKKTVKSIKEQTNRDFQYIIIDGSSTDNTLEIIEENKDIVDFYVSEKDKGIYDAMNKGVIHSNGSMLLFLNAGDELYSKDVVENILNCKDEDWDILYGDVMLVKNGLSILKRQPMNINKEYFFKDNLCHQSIIFKKKIIEKNKGFNIRESIFADFELLFKSILENEVKFKRINHVICKYDLTGISSQKSFLFNFIERSRIIKQYVNKKEFAYYLIYWLINKPTSFLVHKMRLRRNI
ncbi:glycosyltransferase family 2 protein [Bacillus mobilis]